VPQALQAAAELDAKGISAEIIDPRTLVPCDWELVFGSVRRTGRLVVADPARRTCGAASEIAARVMENCWPALRAAPARVTWEDVPIPFSPVLEKAVTLSAEKIRAAAADVLGRKAG
jgi:pyruvate dehydrogenase E1 component beta subunit